MRTILICIGTLLRAPRQMHRALQHLLWVSWDVSRPGNAFRKQLFVVVTIQEVQFVVMKRRLPAVATTCAAAPATTHRGREEMTESTLTGPLGFIRTSNHLGRVSIRVWYQ